MNFYKATKEGFDGKQVRKPGEVFQFDGPRGSWMVPCDEHGRVTETVAKQRDTRLGTKVSSNLTREDYREECRKRGITFKATQGAADLAALIQAHDNGEAHREQSSPAEERSTSPENPDGGAPGVGTGGTGDQDVL